jgi:hypothetical protein
VLYALVLWLLVVGPKRSEAASLSKEIAAAEARLDVSGLATPRRDTIPAADVALLAKAMPSSADSASLVLELSHVARRSGVILSSIQPSEPTTDASGATLVPVTLTLQGTYRQVTRFLGNARALVSFRAGRLRATGRLLAIRGVDLGESSKGAFPLLDATVVLDAYAYDGPIVVPTPAASPSDSTDSSTSGATAAGATP